MSLSKQRVTLVTGAAGGIGQGLCQHFLNQGDIVLALDHDSSALTQLQEKFPLLHPIKADITNSENVNQALTLAINQYGAIDLLVANAGAAFSTTLRNTTASSWSQDINLNVNGTYHCVEAVRPSMQKQGSGNIVIIGSVNAFTSFGHPAYSAAKAALISYTRALAMEFGPYGIRTNMVCPGTVKTQAWQERMNKNPQVFEDLKKWYPLGDFATPQDIADAVEFLASPQARVITGVILPVDGGLTSGNRVLAQELTQEIY